MSKSASPLPTPAKQSFVSKLLPLVCLGVIGTLGYFYYVQSKEIALRANTEYALRSQLQETETALAIASSTVHALNQDLTLALNTLSETEAILSDEKARNQEFEDQIKKISGTVKTLDKLAKIDKELLQKYSKVYFLNEHYEPSRLREIADEWKYSAEKSHQLHSQVMPFFEKMVKAAKRDGIDLWVVSAYRSFDTQAQLKGTYTISYGSGANAFSADQGYSEHQLGTTVDFTTKNMNGGLTEAFEKTEAYKWLTDNAHKYGFTLSYPRGNAYYVFEPWHWRFVGTDLATDLKRNDAHFYDWDQRRIDEYLLEIFD